ncbi:hypothetical protein CTI12_AA624240 [Artemisia annua]|uniref:NB-ARC domains-containing protein n=1 Tax=Artemisia annua TaxID=35608 RepID=A0A2U1KAX1_ARTAN|nr:hypothetical protein CTI12_AA624240 [Artemisia annua]
MAEALLTVAAEGILNKVLSMAANEVAIALGYENKLTELHDTLDIIRAKLSDAEGKKGTEGVMLWLKQLKSVVDIADDVLDEVHYKLLRREVKKRYQGNKARKIPCFPNLKKFLFKREMGHKIENINTTFSQICERASKLGLQNEKIEPAWNSQSSSTDPNLDEFKIVGRENDELRIVELLTNSRQGERLTIVPIVGMGGIGKTTLAKSVYNNPIIEQHFDKRAWLCVSVKVKVDTLLANIYESLAGEKVKSLTRVNVIEDLKEELGSKRYLLVLDDVWDEELAYWDEFRRCMLHDMFKERAFKKGALPLPEFERIGQDIVKRCNGLPLLVDILGSMLHHFNTDIGKWLSIQESEVWDADETGRVLSILKLSFDNLPNSMVKQCLLYCSIFEKDKDIRREEVVQLWMALGLVHTDTETNKEMECCSQSVNDKEVLEGLQSSPNVKILEIQNFSGDSFPEWAMKMKIKTERNWIPLSKLVKITLTDCRNCLNIPMLEDLPLLQDLVLRKLDKVTCLSSSSDQRKPLSPSLRSLELIVMNNLEKWTNAAVNSSTMLSPVLEQLTIMCCPKIIQRYEKP